MSITVGRTYTNLFAKAITIGTVGAVDVHVSASWSASVTIKSNYHIDVDYTVGCAPWPGLIVKSCSDVSAKAEVTGSVTARLAVARKGYAGHGKVSGSITVSVRLCVSKDGFTYDRPQVNDAGVSALAWVERINGNKTETVWEKNCSKVAAHKKLHW